MIEDGRLRMDNPFLKRFWLLTQVSHPKKQKSLWFRKPKEIFKGKIYKDTGEITHRLLNLRKGAKEM